MHVRSKVFSFCVNADLSLVNEFWEHVKPAHFKTIFAGVLKPAS